MINYQLELEKVLKNLPQQPLPTLLLHVCCAPCSSYVLAYLSQYFAITIDYYNPNIYPVQEYTRRAKECEEFIKNCPQVNPVIYTQSNYEPNEFYTAVQGLENLPEGSERCFACYALRLRHTANMAKQQGFNYFCTALSISPHKNASKINEIGFALQDEFGVQFLPADFKKKGGFLRSTQLAKEWNMYRQDYCGCVFSMRKQNNL